MGDESRAKDILQDAFIRIFKSFKTFDPDKGHLTSWMRKITINVALKTLSKEKLNFSPLSLDINEKLSG